MTRMRSSREQDERRSGPPSLSPEIEAIADRVRRLLPSRHDPERFHVEKDEIERELRRLARRSTR